MPWSVLYDTLHVIVSHCDIEILFSELLKSLLSCVLCKEIIFPAFAAARDEEPVIVEADVEATQVVVTVAVLTRAAPSGAPRSFQQVLVQVGGGACLDWLSAWCWLVARVAREIGVRIVDLSHKQAYPPGRSKAGALQELALSAEALDHLHGLGEVALVWNLNHVPPHTLIVLGKNRCDILDGRWTGGHWLIETVDAAARNIRITVRPIAWSLPRTLDCIEEHAEDPKAVVAPTSSLAGTAVLLFHLFLPCISLFKTIFDFHLFQDCLLCAPPC